MYTLFNVTTGRHSWASLHSCWPAWSIGIHTSLTPRSSTITRGALVYDMQRTRSADMHHGVSADLDAVIAPNRLIFMWSAQHLNE
jgi:hypothetical protein